MHETLISLIDQILFASATIDMNEGQESNLNMLVCFISSFMFLLLVLLLSFYLCACNDFGDFWQKIIAVAVVAHNVKAYP